MSVECIQQVKIGEENLFGWENFDDVDKKSAAIVLPKSKSTTGGTSFDVFGSNVLSMDPFVDDPTEGRKQYNEYSENEGTMELKDYEGGTDLTKSLSSSGRRHRRSRSGSRGRLRTSDEVQTIRRARSKSKSKGNTTDVRKNSSGSRSSKKESSGMDRENNDNHRRSRSRNLSRSRSRKRHPKRDKDTNTCEFPIPPPPLTSSPQRSSYLSKSVNRRKGAASKGRRSDVQNSLASFLANDDCDDDIGFVSSSEGNGNRRQEKKRISNGSRSVASAPARVNVDDAIETDDIIKIPKDITRTRSRSRSRGRDYGARRSASLSHERKSINRSRRSNRRKQQQ